jgi:hypothetical protein
MAEPTEREFLEGLRYEDRMEMTRGREVYERWLCAKDVSPDDLWDYLDPHDKIAWEALASGAAGEGHAGLTPEVAAYLDRLLEDLPEEALRAAMEHADDREQEAAVYLAIPAFLRSLRGSEGE